MFVIVLLLPDYKTILRPENQEKRAYHICPVIFDYIYSVAINVFLAKYNE